jgi:hypothetical protein
MFRVRFDGLDDQVEFGGRAIKVGIADELIAQHVDQLMSGDFFHRQNSKHDGGTLTLNRQPYSTRRLLAVRWSVCFLS